MERHNNNNNNDNNDNSNNNNNFISIAVFSFYIRHVLCKKDNRGSCSIDIFIMVY